MDVSVLGLGKMGTALAQALLNSGHRVTVWNRTIEKAEALTARGARLADSAPQVVSASPVTIACVARYEHIQHALSRDPERLRDRTLVNLTWGTPDDAEEMDAWARDYGARYLDGMIPVTPNRIGDPATALLYSGPRSTWDASMPFLRAFGAASRRIGDAVGIANTVGLAIPGVFYGVAYGALLEGLAFAAGRGVEAASLQPLTMDAIELLAQTARDTLAAIASDNYDSDHATVAIQLDAMAMARDTIVGDGQRATLTRAATEMLLRAVEDGREADGIPSLYALLRDGG